MSAVALECPVGSYQTSWNAILCSSHAITSQPVRNGPFVGTASVRSSRLLATMSSKSRTWRTDCLRKFMAPAWSSITTPSWTLKRSCFMRYRPKRTCPSEIWCISWILQIVPWSRPAEKVCLKMKDTLEQVYKVHKDVPELFFKLFCRKNAPALLVSKVRPELYLRRRGAQRSSRRAYSVFSRWPWVLHFWLVVSSVRRRSPPAARVPFQI